MAGIPHSVRLCQTDFQLVDHSFLWSPVVVRPWWFFPTVDHRREKAWERLLQCRGQNVRTAEGRSMNQKHDSVAVCGFEIGAQAWPESATDDECGDEIERRKLDDERSCEPWEECCGDEIGVVDQFTCDDALKKAFSRNVCEEASRRPVQPWSNTRNS